MESRKFKEAATCLREGIETTTYLLDDYPGRAPASHSDQDRDRAIEPGDPTQDKRGRHVPRLQISVDVHQRGFATSPPTAGPATLPGYVLTRRHQERSQLNIVPMAGTIEVRNLPGTTVASLHQHARR